MCSLLSAAKHNVPLPHKRATPALLFKLGFACWALAVASQLALDIYNRAVYTPSQWLTLSNVLSMSKNAADLPIALNGTFELGWSNEVMGLLGLWSSLVAAYELWPAK